MPLLCPPGAFKIKLHPGPASCALLPPCPLSLWSSPCRLQAPRGFVGVDHSAVSLTVFQGRQKTQLQLTQESWHPNTTYWDEMPITREVEENRHCSRAHLGSRQFCGSKQRPWEEAKVLYRARYIGRQPSYECSGRDLKGVQRSRKAL